MDRYMKDQSGKVRKIRLSYFPTGVEAYVKTGLFKRERQCAAGMNAIDNLVKRLSNEGWEEVAKQ